MNEEQLKKWKIEAGPIPDYTCPHIDHLLTIIEDPWLKEELEYLRNDNIQLRELGRFWYSKCQYIIGQLDKHGIKKG